MSVFTQAEIAYLESQRLARIATADASGQPHVVPVSFRYNSATDTLDVGGHGFAVRRSFATCRPIRRVAIVVDDLASVDPWRPRMLEVRGSVEVLPSGGEAVGQGFDPAMFRITPRRIISFGIDTDNPFSMTARTPH